MMIKWKLNTQRRNGQYISNFKYLDYYESNTRYWDAEAGQHKPTYTINRNHKGTWCGYEKGKFVAYASLLKDVKRMIQETENSKPPYQTEEERGFNEGGGWSGAVWIDAEGKGGAWHTDKETGEMIAE